MTKLCPDPGFGTAGALALFLGGATAIILPLLLCLFCFRGRLSLGKPGRPRSRSVNRDPPAVGDAVSLVVTDIQGSSTLWSASPSSYLCYLPVASGVTTYRS